MENINRQAILKSEIDNLKREIRNFNITAEQKEIVKNTIRKIEEKLSQAKYIFPIYSHLSTHHILLNGLTSQPELVDLLSPDELSAALLLDYNNLKVTDQNTAKYNLQHKFTTNNQIVDAKELTLNLFNHIKEINKGKEKYLPEFLLLATTQIKDPNKRWTEEDKNTLFFNSPVLPEIFNLIQDSEFLTGAQTKEYLNYGIKTAKILNTDTKELWENKNSPYRNLTPLRAIHNFGINIPDNNFSFNKERKKYVLDNLQAPPNLKEIKDRLIARGLLSPQENITSSQIQQESIYLKKQQIASATKSSLHLDKTILYVENGIITKKPVRELANKLTPKALEEAIGMNELMTNLKPEDIKDQTFFKTYYNYTKPKFNAQAFIALQELYINNKNQKPPRDINIIYPDTKNDKVYRGILLSKNNPTYLFAGNITDCCQKINGEAESVIWDIAQNVNSWIFAILDDNNKIIAQSYVWKSNGAYTIDSIESQYHQIPEDNIPLQDFFNIHLKNIYKEFASQLNNLVFIGNNNTPAKINPISPKIYKQDFKNQEGIYSADSSNKKLFHANYNDITLDEKPDNLADKELQIIKFNDAIRNSNYNMAEKIYEKYAPNLELTSSDNVIIQILLFNKALNEELNTNILKNSTLYKTYLPTAEKLIFDKITELIINDKETQYLYDLLEIYLISNAKEKLINIFQTAYYNQPLIYKLKEKYQHLYQDPQIIIANYLKENGTQIVSTKGHIHILDTTLNPNIEPLNEYIINMAKFNNITITQRTDNIDDPKILT